jgi:hypothetical protein
LCVRASPRAIFAPHPLKKIREPRRTFVIPNRQSKAWSLEPGAWSLEPGAWSLEPVAGNTSLRPPIRGPGPRPSPVESPPSPAFADGVGIRVSRPLSPAFQIIDKSNTYPAAASRFPLFRPPLPQEVPVNRAVVGGAPLTRNQREARKNRGFWRGRNPATCNRKPGFGAPDQVPRGPYPFTFFTGQTRGGRAVATAPYTLAYSFVCNLIRSSSNNSIC